MKFEERNMEEDITDAQWAHQQELERRRRSSMPRSTIVVLEALLLAMSLLATGAGIINMLSGGSDWLSVAIAMIAATSWYAFGVLIEAMSKWK